MAKTDVKMNLPWVEKYRPSTLDDLVSQEDIIKTVRKFIKEDQVPHLLFYGPPGTGKTSTILACARQLYTPIQFPSMVLELNASDDRGIGIVRGQILTFASTRTIFKSGFKLIILDEADAMTMDAQNALRRKEYITLNTLLEKLEVKHIFHGSPSSLRKVLLDIGFKWKKDDPRRGLMELGHIALKRVNFPSSYVKSKSEGLYQFVFLDETWIFKDGTISRSWQDSNVKSVKCTKVDGKRYIILHAGNENGFVDGAELVFSSKSKCSDYHGEMNQENFLRWFEHQLIANLQEPSIIVMDNASYHSSVEHKNPTSAWKKADIEKWLRNNHIDFDDTLLKPQLLQIVNQNKVPITYIADSLAEKCGHKVLRLPPYHCIFNPIEKVWAITKTYYNKHVGRDGRSDENCLSLWKEALRTVTPAVWANCIGHTEKEIQEWWDREIQLDQENVAPFIINLNDDSDSSDVDFSEDST